MVADDENPARRRLVSKNASAFADKFANIRGFGSTRKARKGGNGIE